MYIFKVYYYLIKTERSRKACSAYLYILSLFLIKSLKSLFVVKPAAIFVFKLDVEPLVTIFPILC